jgi:hypothetical protein
MSPLTENFESRLLSELQQLVTERPAPSRARAARPRRARRRLLTASAAAAGTAVAVAAGVLVLSDAGHPSAAYAVERAPDGTVTVEIRSLRDAAGLERKLNEAGVRAKVDYLPLGMMCREPRFTPARSGGRFSASQRIRPDGTATFTLDPRQLSANDTLVITSSSGTPAGKRPVSSLGIAIARGDVAPCTPVKDARPAPPAAPPGDDRGGPRLDQSSGPDQGLQQGAG